jgi:putative redox protein
MTVGNAVVRSVERTRTIFARRPTAARVRKTATARLVAGGWQTEVRLGGHTLLVDQPVALGGGDAGPNPGDLIRAALAACLVQGYAMHAARLGVVLHGITVEVQTEIDLRVAWGIEAPSPPGFGTVRYTVTVATDAPLERVEALSRYVMGHSPSVDDLRRAIPLEGRTLIRRPADTSA